VQLRVVLEPSRLTQYPLNRSTLLLSHSFFFHELKSVSTETKGTLCRLRTGLTRSTRVPLVRLGSGGAPDTSCRTDLPLNRCVVAGGITPAGTSSGPAPVGWGPFSMAQSGLARPGGGELTGSMGDRGGRATGHGVWGPRGAQAVGDDGARNTEGVHRGGP